MSGLAHTQYEDLRTYRHGRPTWRLGGHSGSLLRGGYLVMHGHDMVRISEEGQAALSQYEARYGVTPREDDAR